MCSISELCRSMSLENVIWSSALGIGFILLVGGVLYWLLMKHRSEVHYAKAAIIEFLACWIMYIPHELYNNLSENPNVFLRIIESIVTALLKSINVYSGNGYERIVYKGDITFTSIYSIVRMSANIMLLLLIGGVIIKFLDGPMQKIKLHFFQRYKSYVFSDCNKKTLAIAHSIAKSLDIPKKRNIIFTCAMKNVLPENKEKAGLIDALFIDESLGYVIKRLINKSKGVEFFLFDLDEENNLIQLEDVCSELTNCKGQEIKLYVELQKTPWSLYDGAISKFGFGDNPSVGVNFIRTEENFIYNYLLEHSIFERYNEKEGVRWIKILIVGEMNDRNLELLKAVLHLGQMPGYKIIVCVIEASCDRSRLYQSMPEIKDECNEMGDAIYSLHFWENIDYDSVDFDNIIFNEIPDFTFAFVNVGDDLKNVNLAMRINAFCHRINRPLKEYSVHVNVICQEMCDKWNQDLLEGIEIVGGFDRTYDYQFITMSKIEEASKKIHEARYGKTKNWNTYCNNEYNRHSVYARTLSFKYKVQLIDERNEDDNSCDPYDKYRITRKNIIDADGKESNIWKIYEHMRWNMYTRTLGYRLANQKLLNPDGSLDKKVRSLARVHNDLVGFETLNDAEKQKDGLELTKEIVDVLKSI